MHQASVLHVAKTAVAPLTADGGAAAFSPAVRLSIRNTQVSADAASGNGCPLLLLQRTLFSKEQEGGTQIGGGGEGSAS